MFHPGELQAQKKAGYQQVKAALYPSMPEQHRLFYQDLQTFYITVQDGSGYPFAALVQGAPGFIATPDESHFSLLRSAIEAVPYLPALKPGMAFGGLGIDFASRRRNRVNAVVEGFSDNRLQLHVQESFGNCPQYIQRRTLPAQDKRRSLHIEPLYTLDADARYLISAADTFFVASHAPRSQGMGGADISHRGGLPGFITLRQGKLFIPDYSGNRYMNTLGNLLLDPRCALLIMDFHQGAALHIQGRVEILWQSPGEGRVERYWTVEPERILRLRQLLPAAGTDVEYAVSTLAAER
ncbi:pyridoxamine 5'-phosphate oxidase family protein [Erwinia rhapontici]|uniref:pyridoxamine 5'-phosphate oxidase family protein n=1 Tax=Erwinia rhapontici TaxID=55212 RepID=UPI001D0D8CB5|nr:pyridoxamine 5'-phosphate oxidase family protein [Erwinia rhapontici]UDQ82261.1 pyridoxamine 5'-phosphate oxidase family protein [Erwinia rhapontici]